MNKTFLAVEINPTTLPTIFPPARFVNIASFLNLIIPLLMTVASVIFLFMLILGGYTTLTASGDPEKVKKAQKTFQFSVLGFVIIMVSYLLVKILGLIFKINFPF
jgi:heme O synthase-like polyprenyltransferase